MSFADEHGMSAEDFEALKAQTRKVVDGLFEQGGYPAIERAYHSFDILIEVSTLTVEQSYLRMVLGNILVMA